MKLKPREKAFLVRLTLPPGCYVGDMRDMIEDAIKCYPGSLCLVDPRRALDRDSVQVVLHTPKPKLTSLNREEG